MPRLAEKTLELTLCSQIAVSIRRMMVWFGLTQRQEAQAGFDACSAINGRFFVFQFKASSVDTSSGSRRFVAPHNQMTQLQYLAGGERELVFYVFPLVGTTSELKTKRDVINYTWLLDVADIPPMTPPTTRAGGLRKSGYHYVDVCPPIAVIHSEPTEVRLVRADQVVRRLPESLGLLATNHNAQGFLLDVGSKLGRKVYGGYFQ